MVANLEGAEKRRLQAARPGISHEHRHGLVEVPSGAPDDGIPLLDEANSDLADGFVPRRPLSRRERPVLQDGLGVCTAILRLDHDDRVDWILPGCATLSIDCRAARPRLTPTSPATTSCFW